MSKASILFVAVVILFVVSFIYVRRMDNRTSSMLSGNDIAPPEVVDNAKKENVKDLSFPGVLPSEKIHNKQAVISTAYGDVIIKLLDVEAPKTVSNFVYLAGQGFYDRLTFHRVVPDFVVQGGDPKGNGTGGPGYQFEDEPVKRDYKRGIVAMANAGPNTNGSQFFIVLKDQQSLPKNYTIFGEVLMGMDVVDKIKIGDVMSRIVIK